MDKPLTRSIDLLPNLCSVGAVFVLVIGGELLALLIALLTSQSWSGLALQLADTSLIVQWIGLSSAALICLGKPLTRRLPAFAQGLLLFGVVVGVAALITKISGPLLRGHDISTFLVARNAAVAALVALALWRYFTLLAKWRQQVQAEANAQFQALQARIRPHFLFNSMNTLANLTRTNAEQAETMTEDLAALFRAAMADSSAAHSLSDELRLTRRYLAVECQRLGERLNVDWKVSDNLPHCLMPRLVLQPLVENAVYHGIEPSRWAGIIAINLQTDRSWITLTVSNTLPEKSEQQPPRAGNHMAVENIRRRLDAFFAEQASLTFSQADGQYHARLRVPKTRERL